MGGTGSGGARARSGPPPDPNALRRERDAGQWVTLPAGGRTDPAPEWPLVLDVEPERRAREADLWEQAWRKPQAVMWERLGMVDTVALYVRRFAEAEVPGSPVAVSTLVKQLSDALGISIPGMNSLRWRIDGAAPAPAAQPARSKAAGRTSARDRFKVHEGGGA